MERKLEIRRRTIERRKRTSIKQRILDVIPRNNDWLILQAYVIVNLSLTSPFGMQSF